MIITSIFSFVAVLTLPAAGSAFRHRDIAARDSTQSAVITPFACHQGSPDTGGASDAFFSCTCDDGSTYPTLSGTKSCGYTAPPPGSHSSSIKQSLVPIPTTTTENILSILEGTHSKATSTTKVSLSLLQNTIPRPSSTEEPNLPPLQSTAPHASSSQTIVFPLTANPPPPLQTFTALPPLTILTLSSATADGHTTMTGKDGKATPFPIIKPHCFFCPAGINAGFVLQGVGPGIYPRAPPPIGFPTSIPPLTVDLQGNPTYKSTPASQTEPDSQKPTKITSASRISQASSGSTQETSTTSTSSTSSTTSQAPSSCPSFGIPNDVQDPTDEDDGTEDGSGEIGTNDFDSDSVSKSKRNSIAGRISLPWSIRAAQSLWKRGSKKWQPRNCGLKKQVKEPSRATAKMLTNPDGSPAFAASTLWYITALRPNTCGAWTYKKIEGDVRNEKDARGKNNYQYDDGTEVPPGQLSENSLVNIDHVYELKLLKDFFDFDIDTSSNPPQYCKVFQSFWDITNPEAAISYEKDFSRSFYDGSQISRLGAAGEWTRLQTMFKLLPGTANSKWADFAGMDKNVNMRKGWMLEQGLPNLGKVEIARREEKNPALGWLQDLNLMGVAIDVMHDPEVALRFQRTNARIYGAFQQIEEVTGECPSAPRYAEKYSSWMENRLSTQGAEVRSFVQSIIATSLPPSALTSTLLDPAGVSTGEDTSLAAMLAAVTQAYPVKHFNFDGAKLLSWPTEPDPTQSISIRKRDAAAPACTRTSSSGATGSSLVNTPKSASTPITKAPTKATSVSLAATASPGSTSPAANPASVALKSSPKSFGNIVSTKLPKSRVTPVPAKISPDSVSCTVRCDTPQASALPRGICVCTCPNGDSALAAGKQGDSCPQPRVTLIAR